MGKCDNCGKKIRYNQYKRYRDKILCYDCYDTRLERKRAKRKAAEEKVIKDQERKKDEKIEDSNPHGYNYNPLENAEKEKDAAKE